MKSFEERALYSRPDYGPTRGGLGAGRTAPKCKEKKQPLAAFFMMTPTGGKGAGSRQKRAHHPHAHACNCTNPPLVYRAGQATQQPPTHTLPPPQSCLPHTAAATACQHARASKEKMPCSPAKTGPPSPVPTTALHVSNYEYVEDAVGTATGIANEHGGGGSWSPPLCRFETT